MKNYFRKLLAFLSILVMVFMVGKIEVNAAPSPDYVESIEALMKLTPQVSLNIGYEINDTMNNPLQEAYSITKTNNKNNLSMQVVLNLSSGIYNDLYREDCVMPNRYDDLHFGYIYCLTSALPQGETIVSLLFDNSTYSYNKPCKSLKDKITISSYSYLHSNFIRDLDLTRVDTDMFTIVSNKILTVGQYAQYGFALTNIGLSNINKEISVVFYYYNGYYFLTNERIISVKSIANTYINAEDTSSYTEHLGVLSWLANKNSN